MSIWDDPLFAELPFEMDAESEVPSADTAGAHSQPAAALEDADHCAEVVCWRLQELLTERTSVQMANHLAGLRLASDDTQGMANMGVALSMYLPTPVVLRQADGSSAAGECLRCLRHSFFVIRSIAYDNEFMIMDPRFREQFLLHKPSPRFQQLYSLLPEMYAGKPTVLRRIVELLAGEMQLSCAASGASLPPWRATKSLLSKWFPSSFHDTTYRWGKQQPPPALCAASEPAATLAAPAQTITGFDAPGSSTDDEVQGLVALPAAPRAAVSPPSHMSALGSVKRTSKAVVAPASEQLWQIRTVKLGQGQHARPRLPAYVLA